MKVIIGTPSYDGKLTAAYVDSLIRTIQAGAKLGVEIHHLFISGDALIQRARNDIFSVAADSDHDALIFIDADQGWDELDFFKLLFDSKDFSGLSIIKKSLQFTDYNIKLKDQNDFPGGDLIEVASVGTGFLKLSRVALDKLKENSVSYDDRGATKFLAFETSVLEGEYYSEDTVLCQKWRSLGGTVWAHTNCMVSHVGELTYRGKLKDFVKSIKDQQGEKKDDKTT